MRPHTYRIMVLYPSYKSMILYPSEKFGSKYKKCFLQKYVTIQTKYKQMCLCFSNYQFFSLHSMFGPFICMELLIYSFLGAHVHLGLWLALAYWQLTQCYYFDKMSKACGSLELHFIFIAIFYIIF